MYSKEEARKNIRELAESFGEKLDFIKSSGQYKEAQIEREFIQPLFHYLNWNISNEGINNPSEREFIVQAKGRKGKEPDYLLRLKEKPYFYIEAKHSKYYLGGKTEERGKVKERTDYIWQAYSYSYSTQTRPSYEKVDFALLTDFEEFRFFDCTFAVKNPDLINNYCVLDLTYKDYIENFDKLWEYFEKENVSNGSLQRLYINEKKIKENRVPPDKAFLRDLDDESNGWRIKLAKDIKKIQTEFSAEFITQAVQLILDRFIFLKVLADREIEEDFILKIVHKIQNIKDKEEGVVYEECREIFEVLDKTYNGSVFLKRSDLDSVRVSNKVLIETLKDFLPENSRYNFKVIPVEILGTIYEQFLGKVVVTSDKRAKIDYKPEVRKAGGVYYTPDYIVNYIVENTVGERLKGCKKFDDLLEINICDPACGSGSFLIAAYDCLIKWTIKYYEKKVKNGDNGSELKGLSEEEKKLVYLDESKNIRLTSKLKRDILKSCIYGVDIDSQAVEVTKMSLSLKTLEDTTHYEVHNERNLFHTTILPSLEGNIKCGNSLVDVDFYDEKLFLTELDEKQINAFNWKNSFKEIYDKGKFDCVIGNPPYGAFINEKVDKYLIYKFKNTYEYQVNTFALFIEQGFNILKENGVLGFIIPGVLLTQHYFSKIRYFLLENFNLNHLVFCRYRVFDQAETAETITFSFTKSSTKNSILKYCILSNRNEFDFIDYKTINQETFLSKNRYEMNLFSASRKEIDLQRMPTLLLGEIAIPIMGIKPYQVGKGHPKQSRKIVEERVFDSNKPKNKSYKQYIIGKDIHRYRIMPLEKRYISYGLHLAEPRQTAPFEATEKIVIRQTADRIIGALDTNQYYNLNNVYNISLKDKDYDLRYLLGILNSKLFVYHYRSLVPEEGRVFAEIKKVNLEKLIIRKINFSDKMEKKIYDEIILNVNSLTEEKIKFIDRPSSDSRVKQKIEFIEQRIDNLVYMLYNLTPDEIGIVVGSQ